MSNMNMNPSRLCIEFARILDSTPGVINDVCIATRSRTNIHPVVLGRPAESFMFVPEAYSFENFDREGRALCLGEIVLLQEEVNPFMSILQEHGIIVTALHNHWLFDKPRLMYMHFESLDQPLAFARKVSDAREVLIKHNVRVESESSNFIQKEHEYYSRDCNCSSIRRNHFDLCICECNSGNTSSLCDDFNAILGGTMHTFENGQCIVMRSRLNIKPNVLGRSGRSFLLIPQMFTFESMTRDGRALCSGETVILQEEINPFMSKLREHGIVVTAVHNHWLFESPRLMFMHWESIDRPLAFAEKTRDALRVLTNTIVLPTK